MPEVKMQAEQQPRHTDETDDEFNERNQQYNQDENEKANEENGHSGWQSLGETALESSMFNSKDLHEKTYDEALREGVLPEGVRDEQDYQEYLSEKNAREIERQQKIDQCMQESSDFLPEYSVGVMYEESADGERKKLKQSYEYLFEAGISIKDLSEGLVIDRLLSPQSIERFVDDFYNIANIADNLDSYLKPKKWDNDPRIGLKSIINKRKNHEPLSDEDRDFAYQCYPDNLDDFGEAFLVFDGRDNVADSLLFGGADVFDVRRFQGLLEETKRVCSATEDPIAYINRIGYLDQEIKDIEFSAYHNASTTPHMQEMYEQSKSLVRKSVHDNLHSIMFNIIDYTRPLEHELNDDDEDVNYFGVDKKTGMTQSGQRHVRGLGQLLLRNIDCGYGVPLQGYKETDLNPTGVGLGEAIMMTGISSDIILDTYFGGEHSIDANYKPAYAHLEARHIGELLNIGIPRESIITNIRNKNEKHDLHGVSIQEKEIKSMREAGISNPEILDAMAADARLLAHDPYGRYHREGFTDADIMKYLAMKLERAEQQQ